MIKCTQTHTHTQKPSSALLGEGKGVRVQERVVPTPPKSSAPAASKGGIIDEEELMHDMLFGGGMGFDLDVRPHTLKLTFFFFFLQFITAHIVSCL
jgi:hypothetical protein